MVSPVKSVRYYWISVAVPLLAASCSGWQSALDPHGPDARNVRGLIWLFVIVASIDGRTVALDASTGRVKWDQQSANFKAGETLGSAPLLVGNIVIVGNAGDDFGARGWIKALDRGAGRELWRKYSTGSDADVGIGPSFQPFYRSDNATELGTASWPPDAWQHGGGTVSGLLAYDPELDQILHGTGHPAPGNPEQRPGDNRWTSGLFARDSATGAARWFTPLNPRDLYGLGAITFGHWWCWPWPEPSGGAVWQARKGLP
jgi:lanthanide-dependent methanol dehydrogenase